MPAKKNVTSKRRSFTKRRTYRRRSTKNPWKDSPYKGRIFHGNRLGVLGNVTRWNAANPFPARQYFHNMSYNLFYLLTAGTSGVIGDTYALQLSSITAPSVSGGHQPYMRDQAATIWQFYKVTRVRVKFTFFNASSDSTIGVVQVHNSTDTSSMAGVAPVYQTEKKGCRAAIIQTDTGGNNMNVIDFDASIAEIDGLSELQHVADDARYLSTMAGSPAAIPWLEFGCGELNAVTGTTVKVMIEAYFNGYFCGPVDQNNS